MKKIIIGILALTFLSGCAGEYTDSSIYEYKKNVQHKIALGDSKTKVLSLLLPLHNDIPASWLRSSEQFVKDGQNFFIHFQRTGRISDGRLTDDELTPYAFVDDKLISIGWTALGGAKSFGSSANNSEAGLALMERSIDLLSPPKSKRTRTNCTVTGSGAYKTVNCW